MTDQRPSLDPRHSFKPPLTAVTKELPTLDIPELVGEVMATRAQLARGESADIATLRARVDQVCDQVVKLPPSQARAHLGVISELIRALDQIEDMLVVRFNLKASAKPDGHPAYLAPP